MSDLSQNELRRIDLTLLLIFLGLVRRRRGTEVAAELGLTQSAVSQAVKRLREIFGDDLFLRRPQGMEPTALALALEEPIARAVESLRGALGAARSFDPATASGLVRIAAFDAEQAVLIPPLAARLREAAPGISISVLPYGRRDAVDALTEGRVDLALGFFWDLPDTISSETIYRETYVVVGRPQSLPRAPKLDLDAYCAADHVLVSPGRDMRGIVDEQLEALGRTRRVCLGLPSFMPALAAVAASGALLTLPARIGNAFAPGFGLVTAKPPLKLRPFPVSVFWHRRNDADPQTRWIRSKLRKL